MRRGAILGLALALVGTVQAQTPSPASTASAPHLAILIVGDQSNKGMANMEQVLAQNVRLEERNRNLPERVLPIIYLHVNKAAEKRFCENRLDVHEGDLLFGGVVEQDNYVVHKVLYRDDRIQVPESTAGDLVRHAVDLLAQPVLGPCPDTSGSPTPLLTDTTPPAATMRRAFEAYKADMKPLQTADDSLSAQYKDLAAQRQQGTLSADQFRDAVERQLLPTARDLYASTEKLNLGSPEVVQLHQAYIEHVGYVVKMFEALADALKSNSTVLMHMSGSWADLGDSALTRWTTEEAALVKKYGITQ